MIFRVVVPIIIMLGSWIVVYPGARTWRENDAGRKAVWWWLLLGALLNTALYVSGLLGHRNQTFAWATYPLYAAVGIRALAALRPADRVRTALWAAYGIYCAVWLATGSPEGGFSSISAPLLWLLLSLAATAVLITRLRVARAPLRDFAALIAIGTLVAYLPSLAFDPLGTILYPERPELFFLLWQGRLLLHLAGVAIWFRAFVVGVPNK